MKIKSVRQKKLKRLLEDDNERDLRKDLVPRLCKVLSALIAAEDMDGVYVY